MLAQKGDFAGAGSFEIKLFILFFCVLKVLQLPLDKKKPLMHGEFFKEGIAKLPAPEKSMILSQFVKVAQEGDFAEAGSFAIPSKGRNHYACASTFYFW